MCNNSSICDCHTIFKTILFFLKVMWMLAINIFIKGTGLVFLVLNLFLCFIFINTCVIIVVISLWRLQQKKLKSKKIARIHSNVLHIFTWLPSWSIRPSPFLFRNLTEKFHSRAVNGLAFKVFNRKFHSRAGL